VIWHISSSGRAWNNEACLDKQIEDELCWTGNHACNTEVMASMALTAAPLMTTEELLALPDNGIDRWLIRGELREIPMTVRNRWHSRIMTRVAHLLENWLERQPQPRGLVLCGEAGVTLRRNPDTTVGIDVVYISAEVAARQTDDTSLVEGVPILVVEILSPNDTQQHIDEKVDDYVQAGVRIVWVIDPHDRTVTVYRPGREPELANVTPTCPVFALPSVSYLPSGPNPESRPQRAWPEGEATPASRDSTPPRE
jgi:Uma2 family endonuclease